MDPHNRFLLSGIAAAAVTAAAWRPSEQPGSGPGSPLAFLSGLPTSEMPLHALGLQGAVGLAAARGGGARGWRGALGLGLTAASFGGLLRLHREASRSEEVLERALQEGLGADYRRRISEPFSPRPDVPLTRRSLMLPAVGMRRRYAAVRDLSYGDHGRRNRLDIWRRADLPADARAPVLLQVHGGAWTVGEKRGQAHPLMGHLADRGWVCVTINYRLSPRAHWPDHIMDVKRALAWTRATIADHGGDPSFVVITGGSAGGHLAALAALTPDLADFQPGFEDADTSVAAAVPFYGVYDFTNRDGSAGRALVPFLERQVMRSSLADNRDVWDRASPVSHVRPDAPPFMILHGTNDSLVPVEQARSFARQLREASRQPVVYAELPRAQHAFDVLPSVRVHHTVHAVERFLAVVRSEHGGATPAEAVVSDRI
ncbi:MAG TPA: alpha/beta hydrolase [Acidimicrobiales bacterium]|jgi:acetyl esterase/lipase|nr:alpha/beta hydrolase [Acidimicrobiales bacterium]